MTHPVQLNIYASSTTEAQAKAKYIERLLPHLSVESLKILAKSAGPGTNAKIKKYKTFL